MRIEGAKLIGRTAQGGYVFCNSVFDHGNCMGKEHFQGATGFEVVPLCADYVEELMSIDNIMDRYSDVYAEQYGEPCDCYDLSDCNDYEDWDGGHDGQESGCAECDIPSLREYAGQIAQYDGIEAVVDCSFCCDAEPALRELGLEFECTECIGCGRLFGKFSDGTGGVDGMDFDEVFDPEALEAIRGVEAGTLSAEEAGLIIFGDKCKVR